MRTKITFALALMHAEAKEIILKGKDGEIALKFSYHELASPSLQGLWDEIGIFRQNLRDQTFKFRNLNASEIRRVVTDAATP